MSKTLVRGFAIALGAGMALRVTSSITKRRLRQSGYSLQREDVLRLEPLFDRLDQLEDRVTSYPTALESRLSSSEKEVEELQSRIQETEKRTEQALRIMDERFLGLRAEIPSLIEETLGARFEDLRVRLLADLESQRRTALESFEAAVEEKIAKRVGGLEHKLSEQSSALAAIASASAENDRNLQRLIGAVQRLVDRASDQVPHNGAPEPATEPSPAFLDLPFQAHLEQAISNAQEAGQSRDPGGKRRVPVGSLLAAGVMLGLRWIR